MYIGGKRYVFGGVRAARGVYLALKRPGDRWVICGVIGRGGVRDPSPRISNSPQVRDVSLKYGRISFLGQKITAEAQRAQRKDRMERGLVLLRIRCISAV